MGWRWWKRAEVSPIREFVYLNEVSVESLLASVDGEILVESTRTSSKSTEMGITGTADGLFEQATFAPSLKSVRGRQVQELRKSVAQSAFARFRQRNAHRFAIQGLGAVKLRQRDVAGIARRDTRALRRWKQGIPLSELERGALIEIDSDVSAADMFRVRTAMVAVSDVMEAHPSFLSLEQREIFKTTRPLTELIDRLNGGAIPVVGHQPKLVIEEIQGEPWLVAASFDGSPSSRGVTIDSVVQAEWFWGDPGRTLFQNHRFRILCRVVSTTLSTRAASSYVGTILRTINDELADTVDGLGAMFLGALRSGHQRGKRSTSTSHELFGWYVMALSAHMPPRVHEVELQRIADAFDVPLASTTIDQQLRLFQSIDDLVFDGAPDIPGDVKAALRDEARTKFGLWPWARGAETVAPQPAEHPDTHFLEVEIVAVYW